MPATPSPGTSPASTSTPISSSPWLPYARWPTCCARDPYSARRRSRFSTSPAGRGPSGPSTTSGRRSPTVLWTWWAAASTPCPSRAGRGLASSPPSPPTTSSSSSSSSRPSCVRWATAPPSSSTRPAACGGWSPYGPGPTGAITSWRRRAGPAWPAPVRGQDGPAPGPPTPPGPGRGRLRGRQPTGPAPGRPGRRHGGGHLGARRQRPAPTGGADRRRPGRRRRPPRADRAAGHLCGQPLPGRIAHLHPARGAGPASRGDVGRDGVGAPARARRTCWPRRTGRRPLGPGTSCPWTARPSSALTSGPPPATRSPMAGFSEALGAAPPGWRGRCGSCSTSPKPSTCGTMPTGRRPATSMPTWPTWRPTCAGWRARSAAGRSPAGTGPGASPCMGLPSCTRRKGSTWPARSSGRTLSCA